MSDPSDSSDSSDSSESSESPELPDWRELLGSSDDDQDDDDDNDPAVQNARLCADLRAYVLRWTRRSLRELRHALAGRGFRNDGQRYAVNAYIRLVNALVSRRKEPPPPVQRRRSLSCQPPEIAAKLLLRMMYEEKRCNERDAAAQLMVEKFKRDGPVPASYQTESEAWHHGAQLYERDHPHNPPPEPRIESSN